MPDTITNTCLQIPDDLVEAERENHSGVTFRQFEKVQVGDFEMSIQGSKHHYCRPRITTDEYESMEVALFENGEWLDPHLDGRFDRFGWTDEWEETEHGVGGYIPVQVIVQIYRDLAWMSGEARHA